MALFIAGRALRKFYLPLGVRSMCTPKKIEELPDDELYLRYECLFDKSDIDGWQIRKAMCDLHGMDLIPSPSVMKAALKACRRCNDYALAVRFLEAVKFKCADDVEKIWPYLLSEVKPTLEELGIDTPETLGYNKPELALESVYDPHYYQKLDKRLNKN